MTRSLSPAALLPLAALFALGGCGSDEPSGGPGACESTALECGAHGTCVEVGDGAACECDAGFTGTLCDACLPGFFGSTCAACTCVHGTCDDGIAGDGACACVPPFGGVSCDECGASAATAVYLFNAGETGVDAMAGSRSGIDALAQAALPGLLPTTGGTTYAAHGFVSMTGDAIRDFTTSLCVPAGVPVLGVDAAGATTTLATNWADFMDGTILTTVGAALGFQDFNYFWTGSTPDGSASGHDCSGWSTSAGDDAGISRRANATTDWLQESGDHRASCSSRYLMLGLAHCIAGCPP